VPVPADQYLQFSLGYSPLATGVRILPIAVVLGVAALSSSQLDKWFGTKVVITAGMLIVAGGLWQLTTVTVTSGYSHALAGMMLLGAGAGFIIAPATSSVMAALPRERAGVGSGSTAAPGSGRCPRCRGHRHGVVVEVPRRDGALACRSRRATGGEECHPRITGWSTHRGPHGGRRDGQGLGPRRSAGLRRRDGPGAGVGPSCSLSARSWWPSRCPLARRSGLSPRGRGSSGGAASAGRAAAPASARNAPVAAVAILARAESERTAILAVARTPPCAWSCWRARGRRIQGVSAKVLRINNGELID